MIKKILTLLYWIYVVKDNIWTHMVNYVMRVNFIYFFIFQ